MGLSRMLCDEVIFDFDKYIREFPDYYIINLGAVDAPAREVPRWFSDLLFKRSGPRIYAFTRFIHRTMIRGWCSQAMLIVRRRRSWVNEKKFKSSILNVIRGLSKETDAKLIVLGINKGSIRIEKKLPTTLKKYRTYNAIVQEICREEKISFIGTEDLDSSEHFPDGVHYNQLGHQIVAERLFEQIKENELRRNN